MNLQISDLNNRLALAKLLNERNLVNNAAEIGVWRGDFAFSFIQIWQGIKLHLIDPWKPQPNYIDIRNQDSQQDYEYVLKRSLDFKERIEIHRTTSIEAAKSIKDVFDFVYIDANHSYEHTLQDLNLWWHKIHSKGILAGHDIFNEAHPGVHKAVFAFSKQIGCDPFFIDEDITHSYYFEKP